AAEDCRTPRPWRVIGRASKCRRFWSAAVPLPLSLGTSGVPDSFNRAQGLDQFDSLYSFCDNFTMKKARAISENAAEESALRWGAVDFMVDFHTREKRLGLLTETLAWVASIALFRRT